MKPLEEYSKEELIGIINSLKKQKKFGLVWEDKPEKVATECEKKLPIVTEVTEKAIEITDSDLTNIIIEGDNYHALSVLNYTHPNSIDVIYIDPPYNTGNKDFSYNDNYVDKEDSFRHSKWLSFMEKRLKLAKGLLSSDGIVLISIDDHEMAQLKMLCDEIFGNSRTDIMIWRKSGVGRDGKMKNTTTFRKDHEYVIVCFNGEKKLNKIIEIPNFTNEYANVDNDPRGKWMSGSLSRSDKASNPNHENYYSVISPSGRTITRQFEIPKEEFDKLDADNRISWGKNGDSIPRIKIFVNEKRQITPYSLLLDKGTTTEGTKELNFILGGDYSSMRPKPTSLIKVLLQITTKKDSIVLDFFAGSGTTGQAVLDLNRDDDGKRSFVLCSNNTDSDNRIVDNILYPRLRNVTNGFINLRGEKDSIPANIRYFKTDFIEKGVSTDETRERLVARATDAIRIKESTFNEVYDKTNLKIYTNGKRFTAIVFDPFQMREMWQDIERLNPEKLETSLYIFSYSSDVSAFTDEIPTNTLINWSSKPIPDGILQVYKKLFR